MYCGNCGAELKEDDSFCTSCGMPVQDESETTILVEEWRDLDCDTDAGMVPSAFPSAGPNAPQQVSSQAAVGAPAQAPLQVPPQGATVIPSQVQPTAVPQVSLQVPPGAPAPFAQPGRGPVVAVVAVAVVAVAAIAAVVLVPRFLGGETNASGSLSVSTSVSAASSSSSASSSSEGSADASDTSSSTAVASSLADGGSAGTASSGGDAAFLSDPEALHDMNIFLSNFSEVGFAGMPSVSSLDDTELVRFALSHDALNSPQFWEGAASSPENGVGLTPTNRESTARVGELASRYLGTTVDWSSVSSRSVFVPSSGYVYFNRADTVTSPQGIACVTDAQTQADGTVRVSFNVVSGSYDPTDDSLYYCDFDELLNRLGAGMAAYQGVAVVRVGAGNDYTNGFVLVSYSRSDR